jgi:hypothetical protein
MSLAEPEKHMGTPCRKMVSGGMMSYPCSLPLGHDTGDDPEPCYAVESDRSVRAWRAWEVRQRTNAAEPRPVDPNTYIPCMVCPDGQMQVHTETGEALCGSCGATAEVVPEVDQTLTVIGDEIDQDLASDLEPGLAIEEDVPGITVLHPPGQIVVGPEPCEKTGCTVSVNHRHGTDILYGPSVVDWKVDEIEPPAEPTKQREGDQVLPSGGQACVQDFIIEAMEESKRVGTERYGQPLMTFNGRKPVQDLAEEARDFFVYASQIQAESEATREVLVAAVAEALEGMGIHGDYEKSGEQIAAEIAVDRVMGWVAGNHLLPSSDKDGIAYQTQQILAKAREIGADDHHIGRAVSLMVERRDRGAEE